MTYPEITVSGEKPLVYRLSGTLTSAVTEVLLDVTH
jgi:hypothetical protein